jgi:Bacteriophage replication gene A protein (GPA)
MAGHGLYVPPWARFHLGAFDRNENLTPVYRHYAPTADALPTVVREALLEKYYNRGASIWLGDEPPTRSGAWLRRTVARLDRRRVSNAFDIYETARRAKRLAAQSRRERTFELIERLAKYERLAMPKGNKESTPATLARRCYEPKTWRRIIEVMQTRDAENAFRELGFIARRSQLYCSDQAARWFGAKMRGQTEYLKSRAVVSSSGEQLSLFDVHQGSVSNPAIRRAELMTRMSGFEQIAKEAGHVAEFITLTVPSEYHSTNADGTPNPNYRGHSVRDCQVWLSKMWSRSRSKLKRLSILVYGFRIAEPHHDGTPHWHMVLFTVESARETLRAVLRGHWLSECGSEPGAANHRIKFKSIDHAQGSATGYVSKYIAKNIDGFEVGEDFEATQTHHTGSEQRNAGPASAADGKAATHATNTAKRVRAWATLHGIRQFQQIGGPQVTIYRECRRLRNATDVAAIERARVPADAGDWANYINAVGGIEAGRAGTLALWKESTGALNEFGERAADQITGISAANGGAVRSRVQTWQIVRVLSESSLGPVAITIRDGLSLANPRSWTNPNETSTYGPKPNQTH